MHTNRQNKRERARGGGGTNLLPALKRALSLPRAEGYSCSIVIATDGYVSVGKEAFDLIRNNLGEANMFAFGIGSSVNRYIIEGMARVGMGEPFVITRPEEASKKADDFRKLIQAPVLTRIRVNFDGFEVHDVEPPSIPDVLAERPVVVFGKWRGSAQGNIHLQGITADRPFMKKIDVGKFKPRATNEALRYLWARHRISLLSDYNRLSPNDERVKEVTNLGLAYNLLTAYTSFVAIDTRVRLKDGQAITVKQPIPLPQGVSDLAIGERSLARGQISQFAPSTPWVGTKPKRRPRKSVDTAEHSDSWEEGPRPDSKRSTIELKTITVTEGLSKKVVQKLLEQNMAAIKACYKQVSNKVSHFKGRIVFTLVIDPAGRVSRTRVMSGELRNKALEQCIIQKLRNLAFPAPEGGKKVTISITFNFM